jgi:hypothetical protein
MDSRRQSKTAIKIFFCFTINNPLNPNNNGNPYKRYPRWYATDPKRLNVNGEKK